MKVQNAPGEQVEELFGQKFIWQKFSYDWE